MATACRLRTKAARAMDRAETYFADRTAMLHSFQDYLDRLKGGALDWKYRIKDILDSVQGKVRSNFDYDSEYITAPLIREFQKAGAANGMTGEEFAEGVSAYLRALHTIERVKKFIWYNGKPRGVFTKRKKNAPAYQIGSYQFQTGLDVRREIRHQVNELFSRFYTLTKFERDQRADKIAELRDFLFDPANESVFFKPNWKEISSYEGTDIATAEEFLDSMPPIFAEFYANNKDKFDLIRNTLNERRLATRRIGEAGEMERELYGWQHYVPFKNIKKTDEIKEFGDEYDLFEPTGYLNEIPDEKLKGRTTKAADPLAQLFLDLYRSGATLANFEVENSLREIFIEFGAQSGMEASDPYNSTGIKALKSGKYSKQRNFPRKAETVMFYEGDSVRIVTIKNPDLFVGLKSYWDRTNPKWNAVYNTTLRPIGMLKTTLNVPWAFIINPIREFRQQLIFGAIELGYDGQKYDGTITKNYLKNVLSFGGYGAAVRYYTRDFVGKEQLEAQGSEFAKWANMFARNGGESSFMQALDIESIQEQMEMLYAQTIPGNESIVNVAKARWKQIWNFYTGALNGADLSTRVALYKAIVESGRMDEAAAAVYVKNLMNFNYRGKYGDGLRALFLFYGPSAAGVFRMLRAMFRGKNKVQKWAIMTSYIASTGFIYMLANMYAGEDDDGEDKFKKVDNYTAIKNSIIPEMTDDKTFYFVPRSLGLEMMLAAPGILAARVMLGHTTEAEAFASMTRTVLDNASFLAPADPGDAPSPKSTGTAMLLTVTPSLPRVLLEVFTNQTSQGLPISNQFASDEIPLFLQARPNTDYEYVEASKWLYDTFGTDIAPESIKHIFQQYFGIIASTANRIMSYQDKIVRGDPITLTDIPFAPTLSTKDPIYYDQRQFSKVRQQWKMAAKDYEFALEMGEQPDPFDVEGYNFNRQVKRYDRKFSDAISKIRESDMPEDQKARTIKNLADQRQMIRNQLAREWMGLTGEQK